MANPTRRDVALLPFVLGAGAAGQAEAQMTVPVDNASLAEVQEALAKGATTASALTRAYLARIEAYDRNGPALNSVREVNPEAQAIAARLDGVKPSAKQPLAGLPVAITDGKVVVAGEFEGKVGAPKPA